MKTDRNEFQQLVDHQMGNIEWDWKKSRAVLRKLRHGEPAPRRHAARYVLTFAMLAAVVFLVTFSITHRKAEPDVIVATQPVELTIQPPIETPDSRAEAVYLARQAVMDKYGLTLQTLGVFRDDCWLNDSGWLVEFSTNGQINRRLAGIYTVKKTDGFLTVTWTHDDVDKSVWEDGSLNRIAWGQPQLLFARGEGAREAMAINMELNALENTGIDYSYVEGTELWGDALTDVEPTAEDISVAAAMDAACASLAQQFGLTDEQLTAVMGDPLSAENASLRQSTFGIRVWVFYPMLTIDGIPYQTAVCINAQTGELERLEYTTLGNG